MICCCSASLPLSLFYTTFRRDAPLPPALQQAQHPGDASQKVVQRAPSVVSFFLLFSSGFFFSRLSSSSSLRPVLARSPPLQRRRRRREAAAVAADGRGRGAPAAAPGLSPSSTWSSSRRRMGDRASLPCRGLARRRRRRRRPRRARGERGGRRRRRRRSSRPRRCCCCRLFRRLGRRRHLPCYCFRFPSAPSELRERRLRPPLPEQPQGLLASIATRSSSRRRRRRRRRRRGVGVGAGRSGSEQRRRDRETRREDDDLFFFSFLFLFFFLEFRGGRRQGRQQRVHGDELVEGQRRRGRREEVQLRGSGRRLWRRRRQHPRFFARRCRCRRRSGLLANLRHHRLHAQRELLDCLRLLLVSFGRG